MIARFVSTRSVRLFTFLHTQEMPFYKDTFVFTDLLKKLLSIDTGKLTEKCMFCGSRDKGDTKQTWAVYITKPRLFGPCLSTRTFTPEIQYTSNPCGSHQKGNRKNIYLSELTKKIAKFNQFS